MKKVPVTLIVETEIDVLDDFDAHDVEFRAHGFFGHRKDDIVRMLEKS